MNRVAIPRRAAAESNPARLIQQALVHWWKVASFAAVLLATATISLVIYTFQPVYRADVLIQIQEQAPFVVGPIAPPSSLYVPTQIEILRSRIVLEPVIERPEIVALSELDDAPERLESLAARIRVKSVGTSELYEVSCDAYTAENAALLANSIVDSYFAYRSQSESDRTRRVIELLGTESQRREARLAELRNRFRELGGRLAESGIVATTTAPLGSKSSVPSTLQDRIVMAEVERHVLEAKLRSLDETPGRRSEALESEIAAAIDADPRMAQAQLSLKSLYDSLGRTAVMSAEGQSSPAYRRTQEDIQRYEKVIADLRASLRPEVVSRLSTAAEAKQHAERRELESSIEGYQLMEETLRERYREQLATSAETNSASLDLELVRAELEQEQNVREMLAERATALSTELGAPQQVTLLKHAVPPRRPVSAFPWKRLAAAGLMSLVVPFGLAIVGEWLGRRIRSRQQLEETIDLPVVGEVATLPDRQYRQAIYLTDVGNEFYTESVDRLGTAILLAAEREETQILAVASAVSGEGKTRTAAQLAISLGGLLQQPVLLIDTDLRHPDVHRLLDIDVEPGLRDVLAGKHSLDAAIKRRTHHLHVLTAGSCARHPRELLADNRFETLLADLRGRYRHIIVDTPPLLPTSEALLIARAADRVIICARRDFSRERNIKKAYEDLLATGVRPLGIVLSGISRRQYNKSYGNYGYSKYSLSKSI